MAVTAPSAAPAGFSARTRLLVVAPHPDDETIANGLLIQQVRAVGGEVGIVLLTDGDNNPWPQRWMERRVRIGAAGRRRWGTRRHVELLQAMQRLDVPPDALQRMHWPDMGVTPRLLSDPAATLAALAGAIAAFRPGGFNEYAEGNDAGYRLALRGRPDPFSPEVVDAFYANARTVFGPLAACLEIE